MQEMCSRLGAYTGEGLGALIREQFPLRSGAAAMVLLFIANAGLTVSEFAGIGAAMEIFGVSRYIAVPLALVGIWAVTVFGNYSQAERVFVVMGLVFLAYPIAAFLGHPDATAVFSNLLWPHFLHSKAFLLLAVALIGTTITPYMQFYLTSAVVDKGVTPKTYKGERIDTINGAILSDVVSIFIIIATAAAIGGTGPLSDIGQAAAALRPVAGEAASQLFAIGLLGAALLAATVVPLSTAYAIAETAGVERSLSRKLREAPFFYGIYTVQLVVGAAVALLPGNAVSLVISAQVLNGFITPVLLTYILILANRRSVLGDAAARSPRRRHALRDRRGTALSGRAGPDRGRLAVKVAAGRAGRAEQQPPGAGPRSDTTAIDRAVGVVDLQVELRLVPRPPGRCRGLAVQDQSQGGARSAARTYDLDCDLCAARECPARGGRSVRFARSRSSGALRRGLLPAGAGVLTWWRRRARRAPARQGAAGRPPRSRRAAPRPPAWLWPGPHAASRNASMRSRSASELGVEARVQHKDHHAAAAAEYPAKLADRTSWVAQVVHQMVANNEVERIVCIWQGLNAADVKPDRQAVLEIPRRSPGAVTGSPRRTRHRELPGRWVIRWLRALQGRSARYGTCRDFAG